MDILERMPWLAQDAVFQKLASIAEVAALSKEDREKYDESLRKYRDTISVMEGHCEIRKTTTDPSQAGGSCCLLVHFMFKKTKVILNI